MKTEELNDLVDAIAQEITNSILKELDQIILEAINEEELKFRFQNKKELN